METPPDSSGQRLRWWQEDAPVQQTWYRESVQEPTETSSVAAASIPQSLSFEEELEAEALRRATLERDAVVMEGSYARAAPRARRQFTRFAGAFSLFYFAWALLAHSWVFALMPLIFITEYFVLAAMMRKKYAKSKSEIVVSSLGLTVDMCYYRIGPLFWDEIASVRVTNVFGSRLVRVKLKDPQKTRERALSVEPGPMEWLTRMSLNSTPYIEISDQWFAESAQEIAAKIATFRPALVVDKK